MYTTLFCSPGQRPSLENKSLNLFWNAGRPETGSWRGPNFFSDSFLPDPPYLKPPFVPSSRCSRSHLFLGGVVCKYFILGFSHSCHEIWLFLSFQNVTVVVSSSILFVSVLKKSSRCHFSGVLGDSQGKWMCSIHHL